MGLVACESVKFPWLHYEHSVRKVEWRDCNVTASGPAGSVCLYLTPPFDLSSKADPTSSYTMTGIAVWIISVPKPPQHDTAETP